MSPERADPTPGQAEARYKKYERKRQPYLDEARACAALTIPWVCPPQTYRKSPARLPKPNQGLGARGVSNLTGKLLDVLLPPGMPFFKVGLEPAVERDLIARNDGTMSAIQLALSAYEMDIVVAIAQDGDRAGISSAFLHLPITGNVLIYLEDKGGVRFFGLDQYVVRRDAQGSVHEIIVCETSEFGELHEDHREQLGLEYAAKEAIGDDEYVEVFTRIYREGKRFYEYQECKGVILEGSEGEYPADSSPWHALRWAFVAGEDYARGLIELIFKDLKQFDELSEALGDGAKNAAKLLWMTQGGGAAALVNRLSKAKSGDFVVGDAANVKALQQEKANDMMVAAKQHESLRQSLSMTFLIGTSIQRGGDRVTKFEVEHFARELAATYATEYSILGKEFQEPYFKAKIAQLRKRGVVATLPPQAVKVQITTGIDALGRGSDQARLESLMEVAVKTKDVPETMMNPREILRRSAANLAVKPDGLIPTDAEAQQRVAQEQQAQMAQGMMPEVVKGAASMMGNAQQAALQQSAPTPPDGVPGQ